MTTQQTIFNLIFILKKINNNNIIYNYYKKKKLNFTKFFFNKYAIILLLIKNFENPTYFNFLKINITITLRLLNIIAKCYYNIRLALHLRLVKLCNSTFI